MRERQCELVEEIGVRGDQVERDRARQVVGHDAFGEVTRFRLVRARLAPDEPA